MHETLDLSKKKGKPRERYTLDKAKAPEGLVSQEVNRRTPTVSVHEGQGSRGAFFVKDYGRRTPTVDANEVADDEFQQLLNGDSSDDESGERNDRQNKDDVFEIQLGDSKETRIQHMDVPLTESGEQRMKQAREAAYQKQRSESLKRQQAMTEILMSVPEETEGMTKEERDIVYMRQREYIAQAAENLGMPAAMADRFRDWPYRYLPLRKLSSQGAMGTVYEVKDLALANRPLIMKTIGEASDKGFERFKQEARLMASIQNQHVARVMSAEFMPDRSGGWFVMEKGEGPNLREALHDQPMRMKDALDMMEQLADGLAIVHAKGIAHRDLKPNNIIVHQEYDADGKPMPLVYKLIDFGLAKPIAVEDNKLNWIKEQFVEAPNAQVLDGKLKEYGFSDSQRNAIIGVYESFASDEELAKLKDNDWRQKLATSNEGSKRLKSLRRCADQLPRGKPELAYDLYLREIDRQKRFWLFGEITRLSKLSKPLAEQVLVAPQLQVPPRVRAKMAMMAEFMKKDPTALFSDDVERMVDQIEVDEARLSQEGSIIGTPLYMSPEQISAGDVDEKSDVYSMGVTWYEALAGRNPFEGSQHNIREVMAKVVLFEPPVVSLIRPDVPPALSALIASMMHKDAKARPTMKQVKAELANIRKNMVVIEQDAPRAAQVKRPRTPESDADTREVKKPVSPDAETGILPSEPVPAEEPTAPRAKTFLERARERLNNLFGR